MPLFQNESWCTRFFQMKMSLIYSHLNELVRKSTSFSYEKLCTRTRSEIEVKSNSEMAYWREKLVIPFTITLLPLIPPTTTHPPPPPFPAKSARKLSSVFKGRTVHTRGLVVGTYPRPVARFTHRRRVIAGIAIASSLSLHRGN